MNRFNKLGLTAFALAATAVSAQAATINTQFEFDDVAEQNLWTVNAAAQSGATPVPEYYQNGVTYAGHATGFADPDRTGSIDLIIRIDAPAGEKFTSISATGLLANFAAWGYASELRLSADGSNFDLISAYDNTTPNPNARFEPATVTATGTAYENLTSVWLMIHMFDANGFYEGPGLRYVRVENVAFQAETVPVPEPLTGAFLVGGAAVALIRRPRRI